MLKNYCIVYFLDIISPNSGTAVFQSDLTLFSLICRHSYNMMHFNSV